MRHLLYSLLFILFVTIVATTLFSSCANIVPPTGGPRDSLSPRLVSAEPKDSVTKFAGKRITLTFDEFVTIDNPQDNVIIWPNPKNPPEIEAKLREVTIRLKDSLEPNTTYTINFGKGLKDVNEGNVDSTFYYVFTTGTRLDNNTLKGKVFLAENGKTDSTLLVVLQTNLNDTAIRKNPPRYYTRLNGRGAFSFFNLPADTFNVFVVPNDYTKRYDDSTKLFAFLPQPLIVSDTNTAPLTLYAYKEFKEEDKKPVANTTANTRGTTKKTKTKKDSSFKVTANFAEGKQDFLKNMVLTFGDTLRSFDSAKFHFSDTNYNPLPGAISFTPDSTNTELSLAYKWKENTPYRLVIEKDAVTDSSGFTLANNDTIAFTTLRESDYGTIRMRFQNLDTSKHPVLLLVQNDKIVQSVPLTNFEWYQKFIRPGDYELRMLYDTNQNGIWDAGSYDVRREPEVVKQLIYRNSNKITIRQNWDNETNISL